LELQSLGAALAGELRRGKDRQAFKLGRGEQHFGLVQFENSRTCACACRTQATSSQGVKLAISSAAAIRLPGGLLDRKERVTEHGLRLDGADLAEPHRRRDQADAVV